MRPSGTGSFVANISLIVLNQDAPVLIGHFLSAVIAGSSAGYWVELNSTGEVWIRLPKTFAQPLQMFLGTARVELVVPVREFFSLNRAIRGEKSRTGIFHLISLPIRYNIPVR